MTGTDTTDCSSSSSSSALLCRRTPAGQGLRAHEATQSRCCERAITDMSQRKLISRQRQNGPRPVPDDDR